MDRIEVKSCHGRASLSMQVTSRASANRDRMSSRGIGDTVVVVMVWLRGAAWSMRRDAAASDDLPSRTFEALAIL